MQEPTLTPHSRESEEALIGTLLLNPGAYHDVATIVGPDDFYLSNLRCVYEAIEALQEKGNHPDTVTVADYLERRGQLAEIGGMACLSDLMTRTVSVFRAEEYAQLIKERAHRRDLINAASEIAKLAYNEELDIEEAQAKAEAMVLDVRDTTSKTVCIQELTEERYEEFGEWAEHPGEARGLLTGMDALDAMLGGFYPGLYMLAARTSMGKTAFALQTASSVAKRGHKVVIFSLEMDKAELHRRLACAEARVELDTIKRGVATPQELSKGMHGIGTVHEWPVVIHEGTVTAGEIRAVTQRETVHGEEIGLVVVDYLGLMAASERAETRNLELGAISRALLLASKDLGVPILALHQLNRSVDSRQDKRPQMSDLRESGRLEEDADVILMLYRDGYYYPESERANVMEVWVRKNRLGGPANCRCEMAWIGKYMRCEPLEYREKIDF